jgi:hypothetical protein
MRLCDRSLPLSSIDERLIRSAARIFTKSELLITTALVFFTRHASQPINQLQRRYLHYGIIH